jgi:cytochrome c553
MIRTLSFLAAILTFSAPKLSAFPVSGDAGRGGQLFSDFQCIKCHSVGGKGGASAPALSPRPSGPFTAVGMAGAMWSHATKMWQAVDKAGVKIPPFSEQQAADLFAFVAQGRVPANEIGDAARGRGLYQAKLCASCHEESMLGAPTLGGQAARFSAYRMMSALSQHGRGMLSRMVARNTAWQTLTASEMADLVAYLNSRK